MNHKPPFELYYDPEPPVSETFPNQPTNTTLAAHNLPANFSYRTLSLSPSPVAHSSSKIARSVLGELPVKVRNNPFQRPYPHTACDSRLKHETDLGSEVSASGDCSEGPDLEEQAVIPNNTSLPVPKSPKLHHLRRSTICAIQTRPGRIESHSQQFPTSEHSPDDVGRANNNTVALGFNNVAKSLSTPPSLTLSSARSSTLGRAHANVKVTVCDETKENVPPVRKPPRFNGQARRSDSFHSLKKTLQTAQIDQKHPVPADARMGEMLQEGSSHPLQPRPFNINNNNGEHLCISPDLPTCVPRSATEISGRSQPTSFDLNSIHQRHQSLPSSLMRI